MGRSLSTIRLRFALLAAVVLSALSAAEATLAAAPVVDAAEKDWSAQLMPVKDRDAVNHRAVRSSDHAQDESKVSQNHTSSGFAACFDFAGSDLHTASSRADASVDVAASLQRLHHSLLDLPPPVR